MRGVEALQEFAAAQHDARTEAIFGLALALEECASNMVNHGLKRTRRGRSVSPFERTGDSFVIELCDDGPEFDPTAAPSLKSQAGR